MARLPQVPGKRLVRALETLRWFVHHQVGSHVVMKHPDNPAFRIVIPCHPKPMAKGTLGRILKDAGLTGDQLRELL